MKQKGQSEDIIDTTERVGKGMECVGLEQMHVAQDGFIKCGNLTT
jgi:hypothetical protein